MASIVKWILIISSKYVSHRLTNSVILIINGLLWVSFDHLYRTHDLKWIKTILMIFFSCFRVPIWASSCTHFIRLFNYVGTHRTIFCYFQRRFTRNIPYNQYCFSFLELGTDIFQWEWLMKTEKTCLSFCYLIIFRQYFADTIECHPDRKLLFTRVNILNAHINA